MQKKDKKGEVKAEIVIHHALNEHQKTSNSICKKTPKPQTKIHQDTRRERMLQTNVCHPPT